MNTQKVLTLSQWIIQKTNSEAYRAGRLKGWKHPDVDEKLIEAVGGMKNLFEQAGQMEADPLLGKAGKFKVIWWGVKQDIVKIEYDIEILPELFRREGLEDTRAHQQQVLLQVMEWKAQVSEYDWIQGFYDDIIARLKNGKIVADAEDELLFQCLYKILTLPDYVWERKFSKEVFQNSKTFARIYKSKIITIFKKYSPYYVDEMSDDELLTMHKIRSYAQTLEWKGPVQYLIDDVRLIDTSVFRYGTILNSQTLDHSVPYALSGCKRIMTIENKANYENMDYAEDTVYIYCHGFFSAKEVKFLKRMCGLADPDCEFLHWGDLDYGGINIFEFNKENIFPNMMPYKMDASHFKEALARGAGMELKSSTRKKLEKKDAGILNELKEIILETNMVVEQETFM